jgi:Tol biopolymer transport system component
VPSPDGKWLAHGTRGRMVVRPMANPESAEWIVSDTSQGAQQSPRWSPDSRELFYMTRTGNLMSVPIIPGPGFSWGSPRVVLTAKQLSLGRASEGVELLPDGRFLIARPVAGLNKETEQINVVLNASELLRASSSSDRGPSPRSP